MIAHRAQKKMPFVIVYAKAECDLTARASPVAALILRRLTEPANREVYSLDHAEAEATAPADALPAATAVIGALT